MDSYKSIDGKFVKIEPHTRQTSAEAFHKIKENGLLGKRQLQAYTVLYEHGPLTANEVWEMAKNKYHFDVGNHGAGSRLTELRQKGVVCEAGTRKDTTTGMNVIVWDVTDKLPVKPKKKETIRGLLNEAIQVIRFYADTRHYNDSTIKMDQGSNARNFITRAKEVKDGLR